MRIKLKKGMMMVVLVVLVHSNSWEGTTLMRSRHTCDIFQIVMGIPTKVSSLEKEVELHPVPQENQDHYIFEEHKARNLFLHNKFLRVYLQAFNSQRDLIMVVMKAISMILPTGNSFKNRGFPAAIGKGICDVP
ncbi:hypothetical protein MKW98_030267 [Papaver atlanticum]|uniref:Uncharacterized protein n=1 Tax=Papaver atlanticum TaxID=357466 RepID=A0AAD4XUG5_9MAGN|nr:hypothetical protein MKW98_030267 [Papaver atlanticum]